MNNRDYNIDLFRIIAMFFIVILHVLGNGGILSSLNHSEANYWILNFIEATAYCGVNCFGLISGYVMVEKNIKSKSILNLWFQVLFYSLILSLVFFIFVPETRSVQNVVCAFMPIMLRQWWYISFYFVLYFFIPFINTGLKHITQNEFSKLLLAILVGVCVVDSIIPCDAFLLNAGYSPIWLIIMYLFGAYVKKYDLRRKSTPAKCIIGFMLMVTITLLGEMFIYFATLKVFGQAKYENTLMSYTSITIVLASIFLLLFVININLNDFVVKVVRILAPATLGVYLIHCQPLVFKYSKDILPFLSDEPLIFILAFVLISSLIIYVSCSLVDLIRIRIFKLIKVDTLSEIINASIAKLYERCKI